MFEKNHTLKVNVRKSSKNPLRFRLDKNLMSDLDVKSSNSLEKTVPLSTSQSASRELILQLIEALKEI